MRHELMPPPQGLRDDVAAGNSRPETCSRRGFLNRSTAVAAAAGLAASAASPAHAANLPQLYAGENRLLFHEILADENSHAEYLAGVLGASARPRPIFQNLIAVNVVQFAAIAFKLENIGVRAYAAAIPYFNNPMYLSAAVRIATVEGRHAGYLSTLLNHFLVPSGSAFEAPMFLAEVVQDTAIYVASLNGGPAVSYQSLRSEANDVSLLNFALFLEYLESEFYRINVPRFFL